MKNIRTYSEMSQLASFKERFEYLKLSGAVGEETFGFDRYLNQRFYRSKEWQRARDYVIVRDSINGHCCDLGVENHEIFGKIIVHHMNPITENDIRRSSGYLFNPEFLICTVLDTHNAIHYSDAGILIPDEPIIRKKNDTCPWRH